MWRQSADLNVHFDDGFADERSTKERAERNEEMTARDASEIKQRIRNLSQMKTTHSALQGI